MYKQTLDTLMNTLIHQSNTRLLFNDKVSHIVIVSYYVSCVTGARHIGPSVRVELVETFKILRVYFRFM